MSVYLYIIMKSESLVKAKVMPTQMVVRFSCLLRMEMGDGGASARFTQPLIPINNSGFVHRLHGVASKPARHLMAHFDCLSEYHTALCLKGTIKLHP